MGFLKNLKEKVFGKSAIKKDKYIAGLDKSRNQFADKLKDLKVRYKNASNEYYDELEQILILSDVGVKTAIDIVNATRVDAINNKVTDLDAINEILVDKMFVAYANDVTLDTGINFAEDRLTVILVIGVNGVGKTTSIAKLAYKFKNEGKKVILAAGDTFRAGAVEQLKIWANKVDVDIVTGKENSDPASVIYDGVKKAVEEKYNVLICDTAGRIQTKQNLMDELAKINRIISKQVNNAPDEVLLIIDATTGQNGILQAKAFAEVAKVTGIILTKMDGTSKGGIVLGIKDELQIPVKYIGLGEKLDDLEEFDLENYLYGLTSGMEK